jgi:hypothetical protein
MRAEFLDVRYQVPGGVVLQRRVGRALAAAALVEADNAVFFGVEKAALFRIGAAAGTAVEKHNRLAGAVATFLKVEFVHGRNPQPVRAVGLDRRIKPANGIFHRGNRQLLTGHNKNSVPLRFAPSFYLRSSVNNSSVLEFR